MSEVSPVVHPSVPVAHPRARRVAALVAAGGVVANVALFLLARAGGVDLVVQPPVADHPEAVTLVPVVVTSVVPALVGALLLRLVRRWVPRSWWVLAWAGVALALVSMPVWAVASVGTKLVLSCMHVVPGVLWWLGVRRELVAQR